MTEKTEAQTEEIQTEEQTAARKPDGVLTKKFGAKTFIAEIFFNHSSRDTFQDKLLKAIRSEKRQVHPLAGCDDLARRKDSRLNLRYVVITTYNQCCKR